LGILLQVAIHAIGDKAVDEVLAVYARVKATRRESAGESSGSQKSVLREHGLPSLAHRVEHAQHISGPETAAAFAATGTWAVVNPLHLPLDVAALEPRLGRERGGTGRSYAFANLQKVGLCANTSTFAAVHADLGLLQ
jgi:predicted amidohydrolase YtcJ